MTSLPDPARPLSQDEASAAFASILDGKHGEAAITDFLIGMAVRGETADEIAGAAREMRTRMTPVAAPLGAIDVCGTGGDGANSVNISTAVAIVVAACGVPVAKHGSRAATSRTGAADTLEEIGVNLSITPEEAQQSLEELGLAFFFAPTHHPALAALAPIRKRIGRRTIFNMLGPLANPARIRNHLIGVARPDLAATYADAASRLGYEHAMIVSGDEGLDELSISGSSTIFHVRGDTVTKAAVHPEDAGLPTHKLEALKGGDAHENASALRRLLQGNRGAYRDAVLLNSAAALMVAGEVENWKDGVEEAAEAIDKGLANALLDCWIARQ
ncbi:anthranilate phosphoribosyltransferase [Novosphingopyxis sp. YJ-S2-01]|uniref:anthranilate phosphoribosyltransferase n=1 Tax=Novosphingopyxis sp. YJ-S2-01 TaxID=2794021 RepID=UPI0018DC921C|nr:anthranilate phosphoribosyltransferase [Novosphingopyxis sp. YJ-S2-01]MBH9538095.1 anthranilate phosphoribosyltransferase [Novosphingopyxis sp. YJ-S2-01]